jgi:hypothetical protein
MSNHLSSYISYKLNKQWCEIMESLFTQWISSDSLALHAAFPTKGLDFLLGKIGVETT